MRGCVGVQGGPPPAAGSVPGRRMRPGAAGGRGPAGSGARLCAEQPLEGNADRPSPRASAARRGGRAPEARGPSPPGGDTPARPGTTRWCGTSVSSCTSPSSSHPSVRASIHAPATLVHAAPPVLPSSRAGPPTSARSLGSPGSRRGAAVGLQTPTPFYNSPSCRISPALPTLPKPQPKAA